MRSWIRRRLGRFLAWCLADQVVNLDTVSARLAIAGRAELGPFGLDIMNSEGAVTLRLSAIDDAACIAVMGAENAIRIRASEHGELRISSDQDGVCTSFMDGNGIERIAIRVYPDGTSAATMTGLRKVLGIFCEPGQEPIATEGKVPIPDSF